MPCDPLFFLMIGQPVPVLLAQQPLPCLALQVQPTGKLEDPRHRPVGTVPGIWDARIQGTVSRLVWNGWPSAVTKNARNRVTPLPALNSWTGVLAGTFAV